MVCCVLFVVCGWFVIGRLLIVVYYSLSFLGCLLKLIDVDCCSLVVVRWLSLVVGCSLSVVRCSLLVICVVLLLLVCCCVLLSVVACCLLIVVVRCSLSVVVVCCSLFVVFCWLCVV